MDTKIALKKEICNESVLKIFICMAKNKEIIESDLMNKLSEIFDPTNQSNESINILLIKIFEFAVKNNQTLDFDLLNKLELALMAKRLKKKVLPVFIYLAQKAETVSGFIMNELIKMLVKNDEVWKQDLLSAVGSMIEANQTKQVHINKVNKILTREIKSSGSQNVQKLCLRVIGE